MPKHHLRISCHCSAEYEPRYLQVASCTIIYSIHNSSYNVINADSRAAPLVDFDISLSAGQSFITKSTRMEFGFVQENVITIAKGNLLSLRCIIGDIILWKIALYSFRYTTHVQPATTPLCGRPLPLRRVLKSNSKAIWFQELFLTKKVN